MKILHYFAIFQTLYLISICLCQENPITESTNLEADGTTSIKGSTDEEGSGNNEVSGTTNDSIVIEAAGNTEIPEDQKGEEVGTNGTEDGSVVNLSINEENVGLKGETVGNPESPNLVSVNLIPSSSDSSSSSASSEESDEQLELELEINNSGGAEDAVINAAAVITTLASPSNTNTKKFVLPLPFLGLPFPNLGSFPQHPPLINPSQFLEPLQEKLSHLTDYLTHPNLGFPRPSAIWQKLQQTGNHLFGGGNGGVFGVGQVGGQDYPFPYRNAERIGKILNVGKVDGRVGEEVMTRQEFVIPLEEAYKFHYVLNGDEVEEFVRNVTGIMGSGED